MEGYFIDNDRLLKDKVYAFDYICQKETRNLENIHNQLGYANKMNMIELRKIIKEYSSFSSKNLNVFICFAFFSLLISISNSISSSSFFR